MHRLRFLASLLPILALLPCCASPESVRADTDPWSLPVSARRQGIEFIAEGDLRASPPTFTVVGARVAEGEDRGLERVVFELLEERDSGERAPLGRFLAGDACGGRYILFGWWPVHAQSRPLWIRARASLVGGEEVVEEWLVAGT